VKDSRMKLTSVNIGQERTIEKADKSGKTGIYKLPAEGPIHVTALGIPEDAVVDKKNHGGPDQAIYIYCEPDYKWWANELGMEMLQGTFGENLTLRGLESATVSIGDRLHVGGVILQVTSPRIPCKTLAARMKDAHFIKRFREAERPGLYCRVLQEGEVQAGQPVRLEAYGSKTVTILEMFRDFYQRDTTEEEIRRYLEAPIASRARQDKEKQLARLVK
jgi:MOSC domain-containing protein YiiM